MMIDIDHFKAVNDNCGHIVGDRVIKRIASTLSKALRSHDLLGRVGGEEFAVLIANESLETAEQIALRLLKEVENTRLSIDDKTVKVTISIGMVEAVPSRHEVLTSFTAADNALYASKHNGRNMHTVADL
jgi:diguanylate cyclase (GGDEF)-like protein